MFVPVNMIEAFVDILDAMRYLITFFSVVVPVCIQRIDNLDNLDEKKRRRKKDVRQVRYEHVWRQNK